MKTGLLLASALALLATLAEASSITYYSDGALVEQEAAATGGIISLHVPSGTITNSLRVTPSPGTVIRRVEVIDAISGNRNGTTQETLIERRNRLEDRLKALKVREDIFTAAAKSQSGKAPRRSKSNPDPLQSLRQGTDFAIAQLEAVYTARRTTEDEIRRIDARLSALGGSREHGGKTVRISVTPAKGSATVRYARDGVRWNPRYDIRIDANGSAHINLFGELPDSDSYRRRSASIGTLARGGAGHPADRGAVSVLLADYTARADRLLVDTTPLPSVSFELINSSSTYLPAGPAALYHRGEYLGSIRFAGMSSGRSQTIRSGR